MMDTTTLGICVGVFGAVLYACADARQCREFNAGNVALVFLAGFAAIGAIDLLRAAILGTQTALPASWREHLALASLIGFGLAVDFVIKAFQPLIKRPKKGRNTTAS